MEGPTKKLPCFWLLLMTVEVLFVFVLCDGPSLKTLSSEELTLLMDKANKRLLFVPIYRCINKCNSALKCLKNVSKTNPSSMWLYQLLMNDGSRTI